jgi:hypothetical protein
LPDIDDLEKSNGILHAVQKGYNHAVQVQPDTPPALKFTRDFDLNEYTLLDVAIEVKHPDVAMTLYQRGVSYTPSLSFAFIDLVLADRGSRWELLLANRAIHKDGEFKIQSTLSPELGLSSWSIFSQFTPI